MVFRSLIMYIYMLVSKDITHNIYFRYKVMKDFLFSKQFPSSPQINTLKLHYWVPFKA